MLNHTPNISNIPQQDFMDALPKTRSGAIDLNQLLPLQGGGTHLIYQYDKSPNFILKVMKQTIGLKVSSLNEQLVQLTRDYQRLYSHFSHDNCLVEHRSIQTILSPDLSYSSAIVSVVGFDRCFEAKQQFGFNVEPTELQEVKLQQHADSYLKMNQMLICTDKVTEYSANNFLLFNPQFGPIFEKLESDEGLQAVMRDFLTKYKAFYLDSGQFMDMIGRDNVLFFEQGGKWQYKVGSVIKFENKTLTQKLLKVIKTNPTVINDSFENATGLLYVPSYIRAVNATALKLGMDKIVQDLSFDADDSQNLLHLYESAPLDKRVIELFIQGETEKANDLFQAFKTTSVEPAQVERLQKFLSSEHFKYPDDIKPIVMGMISELAVMGNGVKVSGIPNLSATSMTDAQKSDDDLLGKVSIKPAFPPLLEMPPPLIFSDSVKTPVAQKLDVDIDMLTQQKSSTIHKK